MACAWGRVLVTRDQSYRLERGDAKQSTVEESVASQGPAVNFVVPLLRGTKLPASAPPRILAQCSMYASRAQGAVVKSRATGTRERQPGFGNAPAADRVDREPRVVDRRERVALRHADGLWRALDHARRAQRHRRRSGRRPL